MGKAIYLWFLALSNQSGLVVKALDYQSKGPMFKPLGGSKVNLAVHPFGIDKMSTRGFWELSSKT